MEKLVYVIWKPDDTPIEGFRDAVLNDLAPRLIAFGARGLAINLADESAAFAQRLRITQMPTPITGTVSIWVDTHLNRQPLEAALDGIAQRLAGYLAVESVPLQNTTHLPPLGQRTPGICTVAFLEKPDFLTYDAWIDLWQGHHTTVAIETQSTFLYVQNVLVRPLTPQAPPWTAIVEEMFPAEAVTDPMVFFNAGGSADRLKEHQRRMLESVRKFIDFSHLESHPMSTYVMKTATRDE